RSVAAQTSMRPSPGAATCGSRSLRETDTTAGSGTSTVSSPSSVSRRTCMRSLSSASPVEFVTCGRPRNAAASGGTCQVSASSVLSPQRTSSQPSFSIAIASVREVPIVSASAKTRSERWMQRSAPRARHSRSASSACGGPIVIAITSPPTTSRSRTASATARASNGFRISGNGERWLLEPPEDRPEVRETYGRFRDQISAEEVEWLFNLPPRAELDGILYVHGSPLADDDSFAAEPQEGEERLLAGVRER